MKASKFSDAQKAFILKQGDDSLPVAEICRKAGISQTTHTEPFIVDQQFLLADRIDLFGCAPDRAAGQG